MTSDGLISLRQVINNLYSDLKKYELSPNSKPAYIEKQNKIIQHLTHIYNNESELTDADTWVIIENTMIELLNKDNSISGFNIQIRIRRTGNNFCKISFNSFTDEFA